jgi:chromosome segregation ATPase
VTTPRSEAMIGARRSDSSTKRARVRSTLEQMAADNTPITFASVARAAQVSTWLVYTPGVREAIEAARTRQPAPDPASRSHPNTLAVATDLALARAEIARLRGERDEQQRQLRLALGARMDNIAKADLLTRLDELTRHNTQLAADITKYQTDNRELTARVIDLEDDLTAARTSLRRMIRSENATPKT